MNRLCEITHFFWQHNKVGTTRKCIFITEKGSYLSNQISLLEWHTEQIFHIIEAAMYIKYKN